MKRSSTTRLVAMNSSARAMTPSQGTHLVGCTWTLSSVYSSMIDTQPCSWPYRCIPAKTSARRLYGHFRSSITATRHGLDTVNPVVNPEMFVADSRLPFV